MRKGDFSEKLRIHIREKKLFKDGEKLLCAVSGGADSMVMASSLLELGYPLEIAHVNFELRGMDSFLDEKLVQDWAQQNRVPFHLKRAGEELNKLTGSLQEKARNFRYRWFENLAADRGITHLVLAHHANDQTETILMQFFRGAGTQGLKGMPASDGLRRRPMLGFTKEEILTEALQKNITWREDLSNEKDDYLRNRVRHHLIPLLLEIFPGFEKVLHRNAARMEHTAVGMDFLYQTLRQEFLQRENTDKEEYRLDLMRHHELGVFFAMEMLQKKGFTFSDALDFGSGIGSNESRKKKNQHGISAEMRYPRLVVAKEDSSEFEEIIISNENQQQWILPDGRSLIAEKSTYAGTENQLNECTIVQPVFPLRLRRWRAGDRMALEGMGGKKKKLSNLLSEAKLTSSEKSKQLVLEDGKGKILWLPGIRRAAEIQETESGSKQPFLLLKIC